MVNNASSPGALSCKRIHRRRERARVTRFSDSGNALKNNPLDPTSRRHPRISASGPEKKIQRHKGRERERGMAAFFIALLYTVSVRAYSHC